MLYVQERTKFRERLDRNDESLLAPPWPGDKQQQAQLKFQAADAPADHHPCLVVACVGYNLIKRMGPSIRPAPVGVP